MTLASAAGAGFTIAWHGSEDAPARLVVATREAAVLMMVVMGVFVVVVCTWL